MSANAEVMRLVRRAERWERHVFVPRIVAADGKVISSGDRAANIAADLRLQAEREAAKIPGARFAPYAPWPMEQGVLDYGE